MGRRKAAAMAGALLLLAAAPAHAQDRYGAIAFGGIGYGESVAYGLSWNYAMKDEAAGAAVNACRGAGGTGCTEIAWFRNGCGALEHHRLGRRQHKQLAILAAQRNHSPRRRRRESRPGTQLLPISLRYRGGQVRCCGGGRRNDDIGRVAVSDARVLRIASS